MSVSFRNQTTGILERAAGFSDTDAVLSPTSRNPIQNKAVYDALAQKIEKTVADLENYYNTSQTYNKQEVRDLIGSINTLTIEVVSTLPTTDISSTTIYFVGPKTGTNTYDEYVYVNNAWVKIGDTDIDLSNYVTSTQLTTVLQSYYTKTQTDGLFADYYDKDTVDDLLDLKQDALTFDNLPTSGSSNPVTSTGIKTAIDNVIISGNGGSIIKVHHLEGGVVMGDICTARKGDFSVSASFDNNGDAIITGFAEIGDNIEISATNGTDVGIVYIDIPCFSKYSTSISYGVDYKMWLTAAGMNPSSYANLDEVLEDEEAVRRLMTIHDAVDYLTTSIIDDEDADAVKIFNNDYCAKWITLRDYALDTFPTNEHIASIMATADKYDYGEWTLVPLIHGSTKNLTYYGEASASSDNSDAYIAFNDKNMDGWSAADGTKNNSWLQYDFKKNTKINKLEINMSKRCGSTNFWRNFIFNFLGSYDGSTFEPIASNLVVEMKTQSYCLEYDLETPVNYRYYRIQTVQYNVTYSSGYTSLFGVQFYGWGPKGNVPILTGNTSTPYGYGEAFGDSYVDNTSAFYKSFDQDASTAWSSSKTGTTNIGAFIGYKFPNPIKVKRVFIGPGWDQNYIRWPFTFKVQASNDGNTYVDISNNITHNDNTMCYADIDNNDYYLYYRVYLINQTHTTTYTGQFSEVQFFGRELTPCIPIMNNDSEREGALTKGGSTTLNNFKASADENYSTYATNSAWSYTSTGDCWITYTFSDDGQQCSKAVVRISYASGAAYTGAKLKIQGTNDNGLTWTDLSSEYTVNSIFEKPVLINLTTAEKYKAYRIYFNTQPHRYSSTYDINTLYKFQLYSVDYSERDWDTNKPMRYIYDHGLELVSLDSNYTESSYTVTAPVKESGQLYFPTFSIYGQYGETFIGTANAINLTNFNKVKIRNGNKGGLMSNAYAVLKIQSTKVEGTADAQKIVTVMSSSTPDGVDISSVSGNKYVFVRSGWQTRTYTLTEWWLE